MAINDTIYALNQFESFIIASDQVHHDMSKFDLIQQAIAGEMDEQVPVSIWMHHPLMDRTPEHLAKAEITLHKRYDHDLIKITFHGRYPVVDWGCRVIYDGRVSGSMTCERCAINQPSDWETLEPLDANADELGRQVHAVELIHEYAHDRVPTMATVFDPAMVADQLCGGKFLEYITGHPDIMTHTLEMITTVTIDFARAVLEAGADGVFLASQHATKSQMTKELYDKFVYPYDSRLISRLVGRAKFIVVHLHSKGTGEELWFHRLPSEPGVDAINWDEKSATPSLLDGKVSSKRAVLGCIDQNGVLRSGTSEQIRQQLIADVRQVGLRHLIVAPGCVIPVDTPSQNIEAAIAAVRSINPRSEEWSGSD